MGDIAEFAQSQVNAPFLILHGSYFGDWNSENNLLRAAIATPGLSLASIWSGLPHWFMHPLALGATLGSVTRLTQNNRHTYKSYQNLSAGEVHIALMGDPTLEMYPVIPPGVLQAIPHGATNRLAWGASPDDLIGGYKVYHSHNAQGPYQALTDSPITGSEFWHAAGNGLHHYMVRAVKLERTGSGSYFHMSQGVFSSVRNSGISVAEIRLEDGRIAIKVLGPPERVFELQASSEGQHWTTIQTGMSDDQGHAEIRDAQPTARLVLYRIYWP